MKRLLLFVLVLGMVVSACNDDSVEPGPSEEPNPSETGSLSFKINGDNWTASPKKFAHTLTKDDQGDFITIKAENSAGESLVIVIYGTTTGAYTYAPGSSIVQWAPSLKIKDGAGLRTLTLVSGTLTLTAHDPGKMKISGAFNFESSSGEFAITNGKFTDLVYVEQQ